jgi:hypothetical protein
MKGTGMTKSKKYILGIGLVAIIFAISLYSINNNKKNSTDPEVSSDIASTKSAESAESQVYSAADVAASEAAAEADAKVESAEVIEDQEAEADMDVLVKEYFDLTGDYNIDILTSRTKEDKKKGQQVFDRKKEIVEKYDNIEEIIKPGQTEGTYIVFTTYDIKLKNVETLVPGMSVLIISKDESGKLLINNTPNDDSLTEYINQIASEDELKAIIEGVNEKLAAAMKEDSSLKQLVEYLNKLS